MRRSNIEIIGFLRIRYYFAESFCEAMHNLYNIKEITLLTPAFA